MRNIQVGSINGDKNQLNQNNVNIKNVKNINNYRGGGSSGEGLEGGDAVAILCFLFVALVVSAFLYLKYHEPIFFWMKIGIGLGCLTHLLSVVPQWKEGCNDTSALLHCSAGMLITVAQAFVLITTLDALPQEAFEIARRPSVTGGLFGQAKDVWDRFNPIGQRLIVENMLSALTLAPAILLNLLYGLQHYAQVIAQNSDSKISSLAAKSLSVFKSPGSIVSAMLTVAAYACVSGFFGQMNGH